MLSLIEVWDSRLGTKEIPGKAHNPAIVQMWADAGHPEIQDDETHWCSAAQCSANKAAGLPMPPVNVNPMARSWLTMGVGVGIDQADVGDVVVWPRGAPPSGHVNTIRHIKRENGKTLVRCVGGNQSNAITLTVWTNLEGALGVRRMVAPTVKDLRQAGSSTIKDADREEKMGWGAVFFTPIFEGARAIIEGMFGAVHPPAFAGGLPEGLSYWSTLLEVAGRVASYMWAHPFMAAILLLGIGMVVRGQLRKRGRVVEHANGVPLGAEVAKLGV